jgi:prolyl 4-hydroxylase
MIPNTLVIGGPGAKEVKAFKVRPSVVCDLWPFLTKALSVQAFNVLRYKHGQHYHPHHDVFKPSEYGQQDSNRIATVLVYLEAPTEGGETIFPAEGRQGLKNLAGFGYNTCDRGYLYKPRSGDAVLFWSISVDGKFEERSLHGGCPVKSGTKWVATKWIRDKADSVTG